MRRVRVFQSCPDESSKRLDGFVETLHCADANLAACWLRLEGLLLTGEWVDALARLGRWLRNGAHLCETEEIEGAAALLAEVGGDHRGEKVEHTDDLLARESGVCGHLRIDGTLGASLDGGSDLEFRCHTWESFQAAERQDPYLSNTREK
jgi:hypothetical protein